MPGEYRYDPVGRLLAATGALGHEVFAFDPASNIITPEQRGSKVLSNLLKEYAGTHYRYDDRGNMVHRLSNGEASTFEWDAFNRMVMATTPQGVTTFAYDPLGRRIAKHSSKGKKLFGWDGDTLAFESSERHSVHYVHEAGSFVPLAQAARQRPIALTASAGAKDLVGPNGRYDIARDPLWNGEVEKATGPGFSKEEIAYYQCDHLGTPQELTDHQGDIAWAAQYKAWGQAKEVISEAARKAGISNPIRFQGQYFDEETDLHYNRHRYYDPHSGRYVSKDPIGLQGGLNAQAYVSNPAAWVDPLGLDHRKVFWDSVGEKGSEREGYQVHHIIPQEMFTTYGNLLKCAGIEKDGMDNLIGLPTARENSGARRGAEFGTSIHNTNHPRYSEAVSDELKEIQRLKHTGKLTCKQAGQRIRRMQSRLRAALKSNAPLVNSEGASQAAWGRVIRGR